MALEKPEVVFSVIIPTYNRPQALSRCLDALSGLEYERGSFEVIVVDDGGDASLEPVLAPFRRSIVLKLLRQKNGGPAAARNAGAMEARGRFLCFTDDDCRPAPDWLTLLEARLAEGPDLMVGGRTVNQLEESIYAVATQLVLDFAYDFYNTERQQARFFASNNMALPAETFRALGGFDPSFRTSEDRDICDRWHGKGHGMVYAPEAVVHHAQSLSFGKYWRLYISYGRGAFRYNRAHASRNRSDSTLRLDFYIFFLRRLGGELSGKPLQRSAVLLFLLLIWQTANLVGFTSEAMRHFVGKFRRIRSDTKDETIRTHT